MSTIPGTIELSFEHADATGDFVETIVSVEFCYYPGSPERGPSYASGGEPAEPASWEYQRASWRDKGGEWHPVAIGDFLDIWAFAKLNACEACDIEDCVPSGPDPDDLRDAAMDRAMERGSWS
jgi:hypothetical protein